MIYAFHILQKKGQILYFTCRKPKGETISENAEGEPEENAECSVKPETIKTERLVKQDDSDGNRESQKKRQNLRREPAEGGGQGKTL